MKKRPLGKHVVKQENVVKWHAKLKQIQKELVYMRANQHTLTPTANEELLDDVLADLATLAGKLPAVQTELTFR